MTTKKLIAELEKRFKKDFGWRCKDFSYSCFICGGYMAIDILKDLYDAPPIIDTHKHERNK